MKRGLGVLVSVDDDEGGVEKGCHCDGSPWRVCLGIKRMLSSETTREILIYHHLSSLPSIYSLFNREISQTESYEIYRDRSGS